MEQRAFELLSLLSRTPALKSELADDLVTTEEDVRERIGLVRGLGIRLIETIKSVRIDDSSWDEAKQLLKKHHAG